MTSAAVQTVPALLAARVRADPARPAVTWLDPASGARVELSRATLANWVAKIGGLLQDVADVSAGDRVRLDLPVHWLGVCWPLACWSVGAVVVGDGPADVLVVADETPTPSADRLVVVGTAPLGGRSRQPVPAGGLDAGADVLGQPDHLVAYEPPDAASQATDELDHATLLAAAAATADQLGLRPGGRLATDVAPTTAVGLVQTVLGPLAADSSLVLVVPGAPADALAAGVAPERPDVVAGTLPY